jgi:hypothetical protein
MAVFIYFSKPVAAIADQTALRLHPQREDITGIGGLHRNYFSG